MTKAKETPTRKINGFSRGVNILQIFSYLLMLSKVFFFSFIMVPGFELYLQVALILFSSIIQAVGNILDNLLHTGPYYCNLLSPGDYE